MAPSATITELIRVAPGTVWQLWHDLPRWPRWHPQVVEARWLDGGAWEAEGRFLLRCRPTRFAPSRYAGRVLSTVAEQLLVWELRAVGAPWAGLTLVESVRLDAAPTGARVTLTRTAHGLWPLLLVPLWGSLLHREGRTTLTRLHQRLAPAERRL